MALRHTSPSGVEICSPMPRTRTVASGAFASAVARLKRPRIGYWPRVKTWAFESADPAPFASNTPVKQIPLAWFRRWPSAAPVGGASAATSLSGVRRCGENHPAVYAKAAAPAPMRTAISTSDPNMDRAGDWLGWAIQASLLDERSVGGAVFDWRLVFAT